MGGMLKRPVQPEIGQKVELELDDADANYVRVSTEKLTERQREANVILQGPQRHTALYGGSRSGKTVLFVRAIVIRALRFDGSRHAIMRLNSNSIWPAIGMETFPWVMQNLFPGIEYKPNHSLRFFEFPNGSQIWLGGLDEDKRADKILGREYATIYFNECSQIPYQSVLVALSRLAQRIPGLVQRAYYDLNPVGRGHWTNQQFLLKRIPEDPENKQLPDPEDYAIFQINPIHNKVNLDPKYLASLDHMPARARSRFFEGNYVDESENALWTAELIQRGRLDPRYEPLPDMARVVVAVDPSGARGQFDKARDEIGIVVFGLGVDGQGYVLDDQTRLDSPAGWARAAIACYHKWNADCIVAETNFGGAMVVHTINVEDKSVPVREITASRGKVARAEPVSALYGDPQDLTKPIKVHHVGIFARLEEELSAFTDLGYTGPRSPNRADALIWAATEAMLGENAQAWVEFYDNEVARVTGIPTKKQAEQRNKRFYLKAPRPHMHYQPHKERRYVSNIDGVLQQATPDGMLDGVHSEDVQLLVNQGCTYLEQ